MRYGPQRAHPVHPTTSEGTNRGQIFRYSETSDLACGKGEMLCRLAQAHGMTGIDIHPPFHEAAHRQTAELGILMLPRSAG